MSNKLLEEFVKTYINEGEDAAKAVLKGRTANELGVLGFELVCLTQLVNDTEPAEEPDDEEE